MPSAYERYPVSTVLIANTVSVLVYVAGIILCSRVNFYAGWLYAAYCLWMEYRLLRGSCVNCYYYGSRCAFGRGKLSGILFRKGDPARFSDREFTWKHLWPDMVLLGIPLFAGMIRLIIRVDIISIAAMAVILLLSTMGNAFVRGTLACDHCAQRELGCPAAKLFKVKT
ncbi:MAG TPA: hypothetical protein VMG34_03765 [Bacteroidota bacterium]|nr:hypothetical protein [Bacteroidota bacterium]